PIEVNRYFAENPQMMLGSLERSGSMRYENDVTLRANPGEDIREALETAISRLPELPPQHHDAVSASLAQFQAMREALEMSVNGEEDGAIKFDEDGNLVQVVSRESAGSADMLARRVLTPESPWSPQLQMDNEGRWFRVSPKLDEDGNKVKNGRFVVYDRETFASDKDVPESLRLGAGKFERLKALAGLRDLLKKQLNLESADEAADVMEENRSALDAAYKAFVKAHGFINAGPNQALLSNMPDGPLVSALEMKYDPGVTAARARRTGQKVRKESAEPAPIMSQRVVLPYVPPNKAETGAEALTISLSETGRVDLERMAALLGKSEQAVIDELFTEAEAPLIFRDPESGEWQTRDAYLSGQVVKKLAAARNAGLEKNASALEAVQPPPLSAADISVRLGQGWVPTDIYAEFTQKIIGGKARVHFSKVMNQFDVSGEVSKAAQAEWGTERATPLGLIESMMNSRAVAIYDYFREDGKDKRVLNEEETQLANAKANEIANEFADWIMADADRRSRLTEIYNREFNNRVVRQYDGSHLILPGKVPDAVVKLRRHQNNVIWRGVSERFLLIDHAVGAGKAQPLDAKILTPKGWKRMGDIQPGDMVVSVDGTPTLVEAVFPQGEKEIFRVTFSDGSSTECCEEHLWLTSNYSERSQAGVAARRGKDWDCAKPKVRSLAEIRSTLKDERLGTKNHSIPIVAPVQFDSRAVPIDPYLLGVILGDGCISHDGVVITTPDVEIISKCESRLPGGVKLSRLSSAKQGACPSWSITADGSDRSKGCNPVKVALDELGLRGTHSHTKFIPEDYLFNSVDARTELLRGLMDTDGSVMKSGKSTYFYSTSPMLKDGVVAIVQSLGGVVSVTEKRPTYTHNGEKRQGKLCYVLCIKMPASINPFSLPRKADAVVPKTSYAPTRYIVGVEPVGMKQAQCIRVAHPSHLYVTDDFIVTHNTFEAIARAMERRRMGLAKKPMIVVPNHMIEQFAADVYRLYPGARVLAAGKKDFETKRRRRLFSKIATGDWDIVVVPHSSFKFVGISPEREAQFIQEEIAAIEAGIKEAEAEDAGDGWRKPQSVKDGERLLERLNERMKRIKDIKRDNLLTFEQLGIDDMTIDEAHMFKNLAYYTRLTKVLGLGSKEGSERAWDLYNKVRVLRESPRGAVTFMTGTPISNSIVEMYTMMRYLAMDELKDLGLEHFDAWHKQFAEAVTKFELNDANQLAEKTRLARWSNMPELMKLYYSFTDAVSLDDIKRWYAEDNGGKRFPVPAVKGGKRNNIIVQPTPAQEAILEDVVAEFNGLKEIKDPRERNKARLRLMDRARKVSLDARAVDPRIPTTEPGGKLEKVADEVARIYKEWDSDKGTQLVFLDRSVPKSKGD
ncbi:MAG TPA: LAGLIDADG family homing endonuclease, partial [Rhodanobacteraceae bacterium]|nr:LAGLIDADG family homing endonuclease [Rhodanobacteraceae bacterium]